VSVASGFSSGSDDTRARRKKETKKHKIMCREDWEVGVSLWPLEDRPAALRSRSRPAGRMSLDRLLEFGKFVTKFQYTCIHGVTMH
jgi:hypothetical protein